MLPQEQLASVNVVIDIACMSTAASIISDVFNDLPTSSPDWASLSSVFAEYRVLSMNVRYIPILSGASVSTLSYNVAYMVWSANSDVTPLTTYLQAANYPVKRVFSLNSTASLSHNMRGAEEATFVDVSSSVVDYTFKIVATGLSASANYGRYVLTYLIQFRGRK
jgi:hypothetical protein